MDLASYTDIILRAFVIYLFILLAVRIFGKKEIAQLSVIDFVFILLISNSVQNAMIGSNNSLIGGIIAAATLFVTNFGLKLLVNRSSKLGKFIEGSPIMLIYKGKIVDRNLQKSNISKAELEAAVREHGVELIEHVHLATLEINGSISVLAETHVIKKGMH